MKKSMLRLLGLAIAASASVANAQDFDGDGIPDASDPCPGRMRMTAPSRMVAGKTLTIRADMLDGNDAVDWRKFQGSGVVSAIRVSDGSPVSTSIVVFDTHDGTPPADSIRFYNGVGSVSITLDSGAATPPGDIRITVTVGGVSVSRIVTVLSSPTERTLSGTLTGGGLTWSKADGIIHVTGDVVVPAGSTLNIGAGSLVMVDAGPDNDGTLIQVDGAVSIQGTAVDPVFFFPTAGAPALRLMADCAETRHNPNCWRGFYISGSQTSTFESVFMTGAGNSPRVGHTRGPIIQVTGAANLNVNGCAFLDNNGKFLFGNGRGTYTVTNSLVSRCGHGAEFAGTGNYTAFVEDCWFTGIGHGSPTCERDGDFFNFRASTPGVGGPKVVRRCFLADGNDDGCDHEVATFALEDCVMWDVRDKAVSLTAGGGGVTLDGCLVFSCGSGLRINGNACTVLNSTISASASPISGQPCSTATQIRESILWSGSVSTCCGTVQHNLVGSGSGSCGTGNISTNPMFVNTAAFNYDLQPGSPARTAGPGGSRIGWIPAMQAPFPTCAPDNDFCDAPTEIIAGVTIADSTFATTDSPPNGCLGGDGQAYQDLWFEFVAPSDGTMTLSVSAAFIDRVNVYDGASCTDLEQTLLECGIHTSMAGSELVVRLAEGQHALICVGGESSLARGSATINLAFEPTIVPTPSYVLTFSTAADVPAVGSVANEDVVWFDPATETWTLILDGSDLGWSALTIDGLAVDGSGDFLISFSADASVPGLMGGPNGLLVDDADIIKFSPTALGASTSGVVSFFLDGSDLGLEESNNSEDIDALTVLPNGDLLVGFLGSVGVPGVSGQDEDLLLLSNPTSGASSSGSWSLFFDGSDVGFGETADEDTDAVSVDSGGSGILLSTVGAYVLPATAGGAADIIQFEPTSTGANTSGMDSLRHALPSHGIDPSENLNALESVTGVPQASIGVSDNDLLLDDLLELFIRGDLDADLDRSGTIDNDDLLKALDLLRP